MRTKRAILFYCLAYWLNFDWQTHQNRKFNNDQNSNKIFSFLFTYSFILSIMEPNNGRDVSYKPCSARFPKNTTAEVKVPPGKYLPYHVGTSYHVWHKGENVIWSSLELIFKPYDRSVVHEINWEAHRWRWSFRRWQLTLKVWVPIIIAPSKLFTKLCAFH